MKPLLHISIDFEAREDVRTLARKLREHQHVSPGDFASLYALRLWCDWARHGAEWRPLAHADEPPRWADENLVYLIEEFCCWPYERGELVRLFIEADMIHVVPRGELRGIALRDYAAFNEHLLPDYKSQQSKGGHAKAQKQKLRQVEAMAEQQANLFQSQGILVFSAESRATPDEQKRAVGLVMRLDMACGRSIRSSPEYLTTQTLMRDALALVRRISMADLEIVQRYLVGNRSNPAVVKDPELVIRDFDDFLRKANAE